MNQRLDSLRDLEAEIVALTRRARRRVADRAAEVHPDLQGVSYLILGWLRDNGATRATEISSTFGIDKGALSRNLAHMEELGLVARFADPDDRRAFLVEATDEAVRRLVEVDDKRRGAMVAILHDWSYEDIESLADQLRRYNEAVDHPQLLVRA